MAKSKKTREAPQPDDSQPREEPAHEAQEEVSRPSEGCPVVGVGASAGGLEAIQGLLSHFPDDPGLVLVIVQHRAHDRNSMMASLLERHTRMKIEDLQDGTDIHPNMIYLAPPDKEVSIMNGVLYCTKSGPHRGAPLPIDHFFRSLAQDQADHAVGIVLSGTGSDGTLGLREIKAAGGMAMVQDPAQAGYDQMPRSAIDTGMVDFIRPVEQMPKELLAYLKHPFIQRPGAQAIQKKLESQLQKIFLAIRQETGHDFSRYKRNTIQRRIARRLAIHQIDDLDHYVSYLRSNPEEAHILSKELLISVTAFFRDAEAFHSLAEKAIEPLVEERPANAPLRIWVPGCATGEEAYSVAMLLYEQMRRSNKLHDVQIFGTDLDEEAIERARYGRYPKSIAADVSKARLTQFFTEEDHHFRIKTHIREMLVFAVHNLIKEPPFSKLDLVCCRNVLIYMDATLQQKLLPLFHYALTPGGFLFLGESESIGAFADLFEPMDTRHKIFRRKQGRAEYDSRASEYQLPLQRMEKVGQSRPGAERLVHDVGPLAEKLILREYSVPCVLIDQDGNALHFNGDTSRYLAQPGGEPTLNLLQMARPEIQHRLLGLLKQASRERRKVIEENVPIGMDEAHSGTDIIVRPIREFEGEGRLMLVVFRPREREAGATDRAVEEAPAEEKDLRIRELETELQSTREYLQTTIEELETSNEELKSANEELQSTNEELQSTNEELDTSREELQSTNEELRSVNSEHQAKIEELSRTYDDMQNLLNCTEVATLFLDREMKIRLFTPEARRLFRLIGRDIGRPLQDITTVIQYDDFVKDLVSVFETLHRVEKELLVGGDTWYLMRIVPYRTKDSVITGVVATFIDITRQKQGDLAARERDFAEAVVQTVQQPFLVLDSSLKVLVANRVFCDTFQVSPQATEGRLIYELGDRQWDIPVLRELLDRVVPNNERIEGFVVEHDFPRIGHRRMILNARQTVHGERRTGYVLLAFDDGTEGDAGRVDG